MQTFSIAISKISTVVDISFIFQFINIVA